MSNKTLGIVMIVVGVVAVVVSLGADALGIGSQAGFGLKQTFGTVAGVIIVAVGAWFWPGLPQSRLMGDGTAKVPAGTSQRPQSSVGAKKPRASQSRQRSVAAKKPRAAKSSRSSRRRGK